MFWFHFVTCMVELIIVERPRAIHTRSHAHPGTDLGLNRCESVRCNVGVPITTTVMEHRY